MPSKARFIAAFPYQEDVLSLPVTNLDNTSLWYEKHFGMVEVERIGQPVPTIILERDAIRIGFSVNGNDPTQDGAAILVTNIPEIKAELELRGIETGDWGMDERDGQKLKVFFVVAPDGLCYYFHEPLS